MRPDPVLQFRLGLAAIALVLVAALVAWLSPALFDRRTTALAIFENVSALTEGAEVRDGGFAVGQVTEIEPQIRERRFIVRFRLDPDWTFPDDAGVVIEQPNPFQAASLSVVTASECASPLYDPALSDRVQLRGCGVKPGIVDVAIQIAEATRETVERTNAVLKVVAPSAADRLAAGGEPASDLAGILANANASLANLKTLSSEAGLGAVVEHTNMTLANVEALSKAVRSTFDQEQRQIAVIIDNLAASSEQATKTIAVLDQILARNSAPAESAIADLRLIMATTAASMSVIAVNLEEASTNLNEITAQLRENPTSVLRAQERTDPSFVTRPPR